MTASKPHKTQKNFIDKSVRETPETLDARKATVRQQRCREAFIERCWSSFTGQTQATPLRSKRSVSSSRLPGSGV